MNTSWIIWLVLIAITFVVLETYAFKYPERQNTLSRFIWTLGSKWPLSIWLGGMLCGGLAVHFFWNWCPALMPAGTGG